MIETLNTDCFCISLDPEALRGAIEADPAAAGLSQLIAERCPHLFSALPLFVSRTHVDEMAAVVRAVESVVALPAYREAALAWAPPIARHDPGTPSVFMGYDFHLGAEGPKLIEINTNAGGALLNALVLSPHPRAHALHADKRNLSLLTDAALIRGWGIDEATIEVLQRGIARTRLVTASDAEALWPNAASSSSSRPAAMAERPRIAGRSLRSASGQRLSKASTSPRSSSPPASASCRGMSPSRPTSATTSTPAKCSCSPPASIRARPPISEPRAAASPRS